MEARFIYFETYGCSANQNNTEIMKALVMQAGLEITNNPEIADLLVINTCIVKEPTEKKIEKRISDLQKLNKPIIVAGCFPEIRKIKGENVYYLGTHHVKEIAKLIRKIFNSKYEEKGFLSYQNEVKLNTGKIPKNKDIGITQISEGCLGNCSFCITRLAKGKLFSYPEEKILRNVENDLRHCKEIWITSQDNASYGLEKGERKLPRLLTKILNLKGNFQLRLGMMNPENVLPILNELIEIYKHNKMKKFLHIPLQSGSSKILNLMRRNYASEDFLLIVEKFRKEIPALFLSTDIIAGFPQETEQDFQETLEIIKQIKPNQLNLSRFWKRKNTEAEKLPQIPARIIKERAKKLMKEFKEIGKERKHI